MESTILRIISENDGISRQQIAHKLKISKPVVSKVVNQLINKGLVAEVGKVKVKSGRPRVSLRFIKDAWYCVGMELDENFFEIVVTDLLGNVIDSLEERMPLFLDFGFVVEWCCERVEEMLFKNGVPKERLLGIGVGMPGMVDPKTGRVRTAPAFGIKDRDVAFEFRERLKTNVVVVNRVRAAAFTEYRIGVAKDLEKAVFVFFDSGLGSAILIDGTIYEGFYGKAGEFGWIITDFVGEWEDHKKSNFGYLARKASGHTFNEIAKELNSNVEEIFAADEKTAFAEMLEVRLHHLAVAIANILFMFDPQAVIFKGRLGQKYYDRIVKVVKPFLEKVLPEQFHENLDLRRGKIEKFDVAIGAALMVRQRVMNL